MAAVEKTAVSEASESIIAPQRNSEWPFKFEIVKESLCRIDETYQRPLSQFVNEIVDNFNPALVGTIVVNRRSEDYLACIDGQTRLTACRRLGIPRIPAVVYEGLTREDEALLFARFQTERKRITAAQRFLAEVVAGVPRAKQINEVVGSFGLAVGGTGFQRKGLRPTGINAVVTLEKIFDAHGISRVEDVVRVAREAWPEDRQSVVSEVLAGISTFIARENPDTAKLITQLQTVSPGELLQRAQALRAGRGVGGGSPVYMAEAIGAVYRRRASRR